MHVYMQVNTAVLKVTTKCNKSFACLSGNNECLCWATYASKYHFVEVKPESVDTCSYLLHYGNTTYCLCPTRNEIYTHYHM
jgi:hypothetical protein